VSEGATTAWTFYPVASPRALVPNTHERGASGVLCLLHDLSAALSAEVFEKRHLPERR